MRGSMDYLQEVGEADEYGRADLLRNVADTSPASHSNGMRSGSWNDIVTILVHRTAVGAFPHTQH
jgi:hypothetical protein